MEKSIEKAKSFISFLERENEEYARKSRLYNIAFEYGEAERMRRNIEGNNESIKHYRNYITAMEFYMEHNLQTA